MDHALDLQKQLNSKAILEQKCFSKMTYEDSKSLGFNMKVID